MPTILPLIAYKPIDKSSIKSENRCTNMWIYDSNDGKKGLIGQLMSKTIPSIILRQDTGTFQYHMENAFF
jgi:hypothetical protein